MRNYYARSRIILAIAIMAASIVAGERARSADVSAAFAASSQELPELHYVRTLSAPNKIERFGIYQSGTSNLNWSADGERLAAYINYGLSIITWSPDGRNQLEFSRHTRFGLNAFLLGFVSGHSQIITSPAAETDDLDDEEKVEQMAFSVMDAATGKVIRGVPGPNPGKTFRENIAEHMALSPDQQLLAVSYHPYAGRSIGVYSTRDWRRIATIASTDSNSKGARALAFSPDGKKLAIAGGKRVDIFEVGSWNLNRSIEPFPEVTRPFHPLLLSAIAFSSDASMIAVGSFSGGTYWETSDGRRAPSGVGQPVKSFPPDPLRVFKVDDGSFVASAAGFPGGFTDENKFAWMPNAPIIAFLDNENELRIWSPMYPDSIKEVLKLDRTADGLVFSPDGSQLATNFANGVKLFDVVAASK